MNQKTIVNYSQNLLLSSPSTLLIEALIMASTFSHGENQKLKGYSQLLSPLAPSPHTHHQPYPLCALNMAPPCSHLSVLTSTALVHPAVLELVESFLY